MVKNGLILVEIITKIDGIQVIFTILNGKEIWRQDNYFTTVFFNLIHFELCCSILCIRTPLVHTPR